MGDDGAVAADESTPRRRRLRAALRAAFLVAVLAALGTALAARWDEVAARLEQLQPLPALLGTAVAVVGVGVSGQVWRVLLAGLGAPLPARTAARVFFLGQLGKYLPGSLWPVLAQAELGRDLGVRRPVALAAQALFMWVHVVTGGVVAALGLAAGGALPWWVAVAALPGLVLLAPGPLVALLDRLLRLVRREPLPVRPRPAEMAVAVGLAAIMWACYGTHLWALAQALAVAVSWPLAAGAFAAAWTVGFLVLIAPAGAGVREALVVALLGGPAGAALTVALVSRAAMTVADAVWGAVALAVRRGRTAP